uniref:Uncharacterized protein n=1 Tax=Eubacterium cellulosolvens (strain ATCC 43171 / JCM 9499 / 6) TaxID=633697 RepID=I5AUJ0_EUBC6
METKSLRELPGARLFETKNLLYSLSYSPGEDVTVKKEKVKNPVMDRETAFLDACSGVSCLEKASPMAKMMKSNKEFDMHVTENNRI